MVLLLNVPLAPVAGAVNVTEIPGTGLLKVSNTVTERGIANAVLTAANWGVVPELAVMEAGAAGKTVKVKDCVAGLVPLLAVMVME